MPWEQGVGGSNPLAPIEFTGSPDPIPAADGRGSSMKDMVMSTRDRLGNRALILPALFVVLLLASSLAIAGGNEIDIINREIRNKGAGWVAGETSMSRLPAEQRRMRLGLIGTTGGARPALTQAPLTASASEPVLPGSLRYGPKVVSAVRDQGDCGSCWAFAVTAAFESDVALTTGKLPDLSEQFLICRADRYSVSLNPPCGGGYPDPASDFLVNPGLPPETCLPYSTYGCSQPCRDWRSKTQRIAGWHYVSQNVSAIKEALYAYGPVVATLHVYEDFYSYAGGVYSYAYGQYQGGHVVEVIGYDDARQCLIAKNSWGTDWGEAGYFNIAYSQVKAYGDVAFGGTTLAYDGEGPLQVSSSYRCGDQCTDPPDSQWRVDGGSWHAASDSSVLLEAGRHTLEFMDNDGWNKPKTQTVIVRKGKTVHASGNYVLPTGLLQVKIRPLGAVDAGAQWRVDGGEWRNNGSVASLLPGRHTVVYKTIDGWIRPARTTVTTAKGGATTLIKGVYAERAGSVTVTITPPKAVNKGAKWRLDGGGWNASGATVTAPIGQHTLTFSTVVGWSAPADQDLTVREGKTMAVSAAYTK